MTDAPRRAPTVLVSEPDAARRRALAAALRAAGVAVRAAGGAAERAKALADGRVAVELGSGAPPAGGASAAVWLAVPPDLPDGEVVRRVRAALAAQGDAVTDRP